MLTGTLFHFFKLGAARSNKFAWIEGIGIVKAVHIISFPHGGSP